MNPQCGPRKAPLPGHASDAAPRASAAESHPCLAIAQGRACPWAASCVYSNSIELSPDPVVGDSGNSYWFEPRVAFDFITIPGESVCVANGSLGVGAFCSDTANCAPDLICHGGYTPQQCRPRSDVGGPCVFSGDCLSRSCVLPELEAPYEFGSNNCALADPQCDIRVDSACGYWLSCAQCVGSGG